MELRDYLRVLRRNAALIVVLILVGVAGGAGATLLQTPEYSATAQDYVSIQTASDAADLSQGVSYAQGVVAGYGKVAGTNYVLTPVITHLRLATTATALAKAVTVTTDPETSILSVTVKDPSPAQAVLIADAVAEQLTVAVDALTPASQTGTDLVRLTEIQPAVTPTTPSNPNLALDLALGAVAGLVLALVVAIGREAIDTRLLDPNEVARVSGAPLLGEVLADRRAARHPVVVVERPRSIEAEAFQSVRTNLDFLGLAPGRNAIVVTSARPAEGKTLAVLNLGAALASSQRVLVIDADLRRPRVAGYLGLDGAVGLSDVLIGSVGFDSAVQRWGAGTLDVLPAGRIPPNPADLLRSPAMVGLLDELSSQYDAILIDTPPLLAVSDAAVVTRMVAGAIVVCAVGSTRRQQLVRSVEALSSGHVFGVVATMVRRARRENYSYRQYLPVEAPPRGARRSRDAERERASV